MKLWVAGFQVESSFQCLQHEKRFAFPYIYFKGHEMSLDSLGGKRLEGLQEVDGLSKWFLRPL